MKDLRKQLEEAAALAIHESRHAHIECAGPKRSEMTIARIAVHAIMPVVMDADVAVQVGMDETIARLRAERLLMARTLADVWEYAAGVGSSSAAASDGRQVGTWVRQRVEELGDVGTLASIRAEEARGA